MKVNKLILMIGLLLVISAITYPLGYLEAKSIFSLLLIFGGFLIFIGMLIPQKK